MLANSGLSGKHCQQRRPRIAVLGYKAVSALIHTLLPEYGNHADFEVHEVVFDNALSLGRKIEKDGLADVILSAGANAVILKSALSMPVVSIKISGYDLLHALQRASQIAKRVGIVVYRENIAELDEFKDLLKIDIVQRPYHSIEEAEICFQTFRNDGYRVIVGSSVAVELAENAGLKGILAYNIGAVRDAIEDCLQISAIAIMQASRFDELHNVLQHLHEAVLAVDHTQRIIAINPPMENIIGLRRSDIIGGNLKDVVPELSLDRVISRGDKETEVIISFSDKTFVANRIPFMENGIVSGAVLTLHDAKSIQRADTTIRSQRKTRNLAARYSFANISGRSPEFLRVIKTAERYARTSSTILITGQSGSGKEMFAQAIHNASSRQNGPFVAINCAAFPEALLESELFGYEEGAFTGSRRGGKPGLLETAHTGTVFLDEIGDMPITLQTRLLRVLQEREVVRIGGVMPVGIDVRIIAATHQDIPERIRQGQFRSDLFYRLNILSFRIPTLADRKQDIPVLGLSLLYSSLRRLGSSIPADQALAPLLPLLIEYSWPGNVRELENIMERFSVFLSQHSDISTVDYESFRAEIPELNAYLDCHSLNNDAQYATQGIYGQDGQIDSEAINRALSLAKGSKSRAAEILGISRTTFWRRLKELNLDDHLI